MTLEPAKSSDLLTATTTSVIAAPALLSSVILNPGSATSSVTVYDNASTASGTILAKLLSAANGASLILPLTTPIIALNGITVVVSGTSATATISYQRAD